MSSTRTMPALAASASFLLLAGFALLLWNVLDGDSDTLLVRDFYTWRYWVLGAGIAVTGVAGLLAPVRKLRGIAAGLVIGVVAAGVGVGVGLLVDLLTSSS